MRFQSSLLASFILFSSNSWAAEAYLSPIQSGWKITPLLNVGDPVGKYRMVGIPDGLGAYKNDDGTLTILMNHEIGVDQGRTRQHHGRGAFVSKWTLDVQQLKVVKGEDLIKEVYIWLPEENKHIKSPAYSFNRLCSADLPAQSAIFDHNSQLGFNGRLFMNGEEDRAGGRAFAHVVTGEHAGKSYELPMMGKSAWENIVLNPLPQKKTIALGMDDSPGGQVYMYVGEKRKEGSPIEQAGLMVGKLYAIKSQGKRFTWHDFGDVSAWSGDQLEKAGQQAGVSNFMRPEDGAWDVNNPAIFYFATTDKIDGTSQLFQLTFDDIQAPEKGGTIKVVLNARDIGAQMFDNITVAADGKLLIEEDPGDHPHMASIWHFDPQSGQAKKVLAVNESAFKNKNSGSFITQDEENSGVIEVTDLVQDAAWFVAGHRYYLSTLQIHAKSDDPELVEGGQLYLLEQP
jgi:hypothetical protein